MDDFVDYLKFASLAMHKDKICYIMYDDFKLMTQIRAQPYKEVKIKILMF